MPACPPIEAPRREARCAERGMTLIELMVVMAIIAVMFVVGAIGLSAIRGADVDASASVVAGAMTYVSAKAVHDNKTYRLILDLDQRRYSTEVADSEDPCARFLPEDAETADAGLEGDKAAPAKEDEEGAPAPKATFAEQKSDLLRGTFEDGTNVTSVLTSHHTQSQSEGKVAIYFYPNGQAERALVWVGGKSAEAEAGWEPEVTVELHALGRVTRHPKPLDERDFDLARPEEVQ